jgi:hypothetical protein
MLAHPTVEQLHALGRMRPLAEAQNLGQEFWWAPQTSASATAPDI